MVESVKEVPKWVSNSPLFDPNIVGDIESIGKCHTDWRVELLRGNTNLFGTEISRYWIAPPADGEV